MTKRHKIQRPRETLSFTGKCHCGDTPSKGSARGNRLSARAWPHKLAVSKNLK
jgi:hypothetical protein